MTGPLYCSSSCLCFGGFIYGVCFGEERANISVFRTFVRFALVWFCLFSHPLCVWDGLRLVIVALPGLFSCLSLLLFVPHLSIFWCLVKVMIRKSGISGVSSFIIFKTTDSGIHPGIFKDIHDYRTCCVGFATVKLV